MALDSYGDWQVVSNSLKKNKNIAKAKPGNNNIIIGSFSAKKEKEIMSKNSNYLWVQGLIEGNAREQWVAINSSLESKNLYASLHSHSDRRLKKDIKPLFFRGEIPAFAERAEGAGVIDKKRKTDGQTKEVTFLEKLNRLKAYSFKWKDTAPTGKAKKHFGFIAQETKKVIPEVVEKDRKGFFTIRYTELIPVIVSAFQEFQKAVGDHFSRLWSVLKKLIKEVESHTVRLEENTKRLVKNATRIQENTKKLQSAEDKISKLEQELKQLRAQLRENLLRENQKSGRSLTQSRRKRT